MNNPIPCPITGCKHSRSGSSHAFQTLTTLIRHLHSHDHNQSQHLIDHSICHEINLYSCSHHACLSNPRRFFQSRRALTDHNETFHPRPPTTTITTDLSTIIFTSLPHSHLHNHWTTGLQFITDHYDHNPPPFRSTWLYTLKNNNKKRYQTIQAKIIESIISANSATTSAPFWWLLVHLELLILAPTSKKQRSDETINTIISQRLDEVQSGRIEIIFNEAFSIKSRNTSSPPPHNNGNRAAQLAADSDNYRTAISRICGTTSIATIDNNNISIVEKLYSPSVPHRTFSANTTPIQTHHLPGDICETIRTSAKHKGTGINADSIDSFINLVKLNDKTINNNITTLFNLIYQGNIPHQARKFFTDTYLFCLHKDQTNLSKLRPIGIPTAIRRILASHIAITLKDKFGDHLLPFNYAVGIKGGMDFIIKSMQLSIDKFIINPQQRSETPSRAAAFLDLTNMFNNVSREELFDIIHKNFPELIPLTTLIYEEPANVHFKWKTDEWKSISMKEGVNQGCPLSSTFASLVLNRILTPINNLLHQRAAERLRNGDPGDDGYGGITHLFAWVDDISCTVPHVDLKFLLDNIKTLGATRGCFINPEKSRILTSCTGESIIPTILNTNPSLAADIEYSINTYSIEKIDNTSHGIELTDGFRLLGTPVGSATFANQFFLEQLEATRQQYTQLSTDIADLHTRLKLFNTCTLQKLPHLLGADIMHNLPTDFDPINWSAWSSPLVEGINHLITTFFQDLLNISHFPTISKYIAHVHTNKGGLGILFPHHRAIPDFIVTTTMSWRRATYGFRPSIDVEPTTLHPSITNLFNINNNPSSGLLRRYQLMLPTIASIAKPPKCDHENSITHFQSKLSPKSMRSYIKAFCANAMTDLTYESTYYNHNEHLQFLPSLLVPQTSYPLISMCRSIERNRLPNWSFIIAMKRKLRLPIFDNDNTPSCPCGTIHDKWGDHMFKCVKHNKILPHHVIRDSWALALQPALSLAGYISEHSTLQTERCNLCPSDPNARPFDISFDPDFNHANRNYCNCPFSTVGADITITHCLPPISIPLTDDVQQKLTAIADRHLQKSEREKYRRDKSSVDTNTAPTNTIHGDTIMGDLLTANTILLAFALDPFGRWGPIMQNFLTTSTTSIQQKPFRANRPNANTMYHRATSHPAPTAILHAADSYWKSNKTRRYYGHSYTSPSPQIHTIQNLGLGITKAFSLHIRNSTLRSTQQNHQHQPPSLSSCDSDDLDNSSFFSHDT